ncbi:hypothetical protein D5018_21420, partial [Parashewanella curva]
MSITALPQTKAKLLIMLAMQQVLHNATNQKTSPLIQQQNYLLNIVSQGLDTARKKVSTDGLLTGADESISAHLADLQGMLHVITKELENLAVMGEFSISNVGSALLAQLLPILPDLTHAQYSHAYTEYCQACQVSSAVFPPDTAKEWFYSAELEKTYEEKREEGGGPYWQNNGKLALLMNSTAKMIFEAFSQSRTTLEDMHVDRPLAKACAYNALFGATVKNETAEKTDTSLRRQIIAAANHIAQHPSVKDQPQQLLTLMYATGCDLTLTDSIPESTAVPTEQTAATQAANPMAQFVQAMMS